MKLHETLFVSWDCFIGLETAKGLFGGNLSSDKSNDVCLVLLVPHISRFCRAGVSVRFIRLITRTLQMGEINSSTPTLRENLCLWAKAKEAHGG